MTEFKYLITDPEGIHARPAGELVKLAKTFASDIKISGNEKVGDTKKIFSIMALCIKQGQEVTLSCDGTDEVEAAAALEGFFKENL
ncbi:phosphocarrier protein HPr [Aequitasia blattaphilus]|uniref:HPr family phosphocarrier protein n=1 Tax=Aequitasia blattaphilus TaxID=2949332 RepID=A0ABT1E7N0_9FIRM|nr:HPr family phosphocarrier protein [Aequitasia blattaphilus]MCP1101835.1 HPr family phosphocarrier protein [Aequitasia blattaphilus]MCR8614475.1 HPr family phosphocarrier protein [Aequitasia blattaphilus]